MPNLTKEEFLRSYSYLSEKDYDDTICKILEMYKDACNRLSESEFNGYADKEYRIERLETLIYNLVDYIYEVTGNDSNYTQHILYEGIGMTADECGKYFLNEV